MLPLASVSIITPSGTEHPTALNDAHLAAQIFGDIPEEFLDPIQYTLMRDPVILATSGNTLDRTTITRHLLSDAKDPFNRMPLTVDQLTPNTQLKQRIDQWVADQKAQQQK